MLPNKAEMHMAVLDDEAYYKKKLVFLFVTQNYWNSVYGISMKCMKKWVLSEPIIDPINHQDILSGSQIFYEIDLEKVKVTELDFQRKFELDIEMEGWIYGLVSWFDCFFDHGNKKIILSTSPYKKQTHWKQTVFYVDQPFEVEIGDKVFGNILVGKAKENHRELNVQLKLRHNQEARQTQYYRIS